MNTLMDGIAIAIQADVPVLLWGEPGVGKTAAITALATELAMPLETVIASLREPSDFAGLPVPDLAAGNTQLLPPEWVARRLAAAPGILFLDELSCAAPAVQAALLRVVRERVVGSTPLPAGTRIVAAANPADCAAAGWELPAPAANRWCHLTWALDPAAWCDGVVSGWPAVQVPRLPADWRQREPIALANVAAFIRARPELIQALPEDAGAAGRAWPSPRTWEMAATLMAACESVGAAESTRMSLICGCVGEAAGVEMAAYLRDLDLPDPEELLAAGKLPSRIQARPDRTFAALSAVTAVVLARLDAARWNAAWALLGAVATAGAKDVAAAACRPLAQLMSSGRAKLPDGTPLPVPAAALRILGSVLS